jgi:hypothetical protein
VRRIQHVQNRSEVRFLRFFFARSTLIALPSPTSHVCFSKRILKADQVWKDSWGEHGTVQNPFSAVFRPGNATNRGCKNPKGRRLYMSALCLLDGDNNSKAARSPSFASPPLVPILPLPRPFSLTPTNRSPAPLRTSAAPSVTFRRPSRPFRPSLRPGLSPLTSSSVPTSRSSHTLVRPWSSSASSSPYPSTSTAPVRLVPLFSVEERS